MEPTERESSQFAVFEQSADFGEVLIKLAGLTKAASPGRYVSRGEPKHHVADVCIRTLPVSLSRNNIRPMADFDGFVIDIGQNQRDFGRRRALRWRDAVPQNFRGNRRDFGEVQQIWRRFARGGFADRSFLCHATANRTRTGRIRLLRSRFSATYYRMQTPVNASIISQLSIFVEPNTRSRLSGPSDSNTQSRLGGSS